MLDATFLFFGSACCHEPVDANNASLAETFNRLRGSRLDVLVNSVYERVLKSRETRI